MQLEKKQTQRFKRVLGVQVFRGVPYQRVTWGDAWPSGVDSHET